MAHEKVEKHTEESLRPHMIKGSLWMISMRWIMRSIGLVSTIILARLLTPDDFGVIAISMLLVGFLEVFFESGQQQAIIRHENPTRAHYDSAWTMGIISGVILAIVIFLLPHLLTIIIMSRVQQRL